MSGPIDATAPGGGLEALSRTVDTLWTKLAPTGKPEALRRVLFTATRAGHGTTTVATCCALGLARFLQAKVTLVEVGAPSEALAGLLGVEERPGFSEALEGTAEAGQVLRPTAEPGLRVVTAGGVSWMPGALVGERAKGLLEQLGQGQDFLLIDAPSILDRADVRPLLWQVDEAVVVLGSGRSRKAEAKAVIEAIVKANVQLRGAVLNRYRPDLPRWFGGSDWT